MPITKKEDFEDTSSVLGLGQEADATSPGKKRDTKTDSSIIAFELALALDSNKKVHYLHLFD